MQKQSRVSLLLDTRRQSRVLSRVPNTAHPPAAAPGCPAVCWRICVPALRVRHKVTPPQVPQPRSCGVLKLDIRRASADDTRHRQRVAESRPRATRAFGCCLLFARDAPGSGIHAARSRRLPPLPPQRSRRSVRPRRAPHSQALQTMVGRVGGAECSQAETGYARRAGMRRGPDTE